MVQSSYAKQPSPTSVWSREQVTKVNRLLGAPLSEKQCEGLLPGTACLRVPAKGGVGVSQTFERVCLRVGVSELAEQSERFAVPFHRLDVTTGAVCEVGEVAQDIGLAVAVVVAAEQVEGGLVVV